MRHKRDGIGTDSKPCPRGCEDVIKDGKWWAERPAKLAHARANGYPLVVMDEATGWLHVGPTVVLKQEGPR